MEAQPPQLRWDKRKIISVDIPEPCIVDGGHVYVLQQLHYEFESRMENGIWLESRHEKWIDVPINEALK